MLKKLIFIGLGLIAICATSTWYYIFQYSKTHHRNVESERAVVVTAAHLVKDYETNEKAANAKYLNKAVELKGVILSHKKDLSGNNTVIIKSGEAFSNVFCTLKPGITLGRDSVVEVKGFCTGFLSDVVLSEAIVVYSQRASK